MTFLQSMTELERRPCRRVTPSPTDIEFAPRKENLILVRRNGRIGIHFLGLLAVMVLVVWSVRLSVSDVFLDAQPSTNRMFSLPNKTDTPTTLVHMHRSSICSTANGRRNSLLCRQIDVPSAARMRESELEAGIQRIYYINLDKNVIRRQRMEGYLEKQTDLLSWSKPPIPYTRIPAVRGDDPPSDCHEDLQDPARCSGVVGIIKSNLSIMRHRNVTGLSLIMEDDFAIRNLSLVEEALEYIPDDWDIIRFECGDNEIRQSFDYIEHPNPDYLVFRANYVRPCNSTLENCNYCGGAFAMLWRESSLSKLYDSWTEPPIRDLDCRLAWDNSIRSYCFNTQGKLGLHYPPNEEYTDIPKNGPPKSTTETTLSDETTDTAVDSPVNGIPEVETNKGIESKTISVNEIVTSGRVEAEMESTMAKNTNIEKASLVDIIPSNGAKEGEIKREPSDSAHIRKGSTRISNERTHDKMAAKVLRMSDAFRKKLNSTNNERRPPKETTRQGVKRNAKE